MNIKCRLGYHNWTKWTDVSEPKKPKNMLYDFTDVTQSKTCLGCNKVLIRWI